MPALLSGRRAPGGLKAALGKYIIPSNHPEFESLQCCLLGSQKQRLLLNFLLFFCYLIQPLITDLLLGESGVRGGVWSLPQ